MLRPMRRVVWWFFLIWPAGALACDRPVCGVDPQELSLARLVDFEDMAGGYGPGRLYRQMIEADGVSFGEHLAGQSRGADGPYDRIDGPATPPLRLGDVPRGALLSITRVGKSSVLNGQGPAGYPKREAEGEGAIAILFDHDQAALSVDIVGGEGGTGWFLFLARDGSVLDRHDLTGLGEETRAFRTPGMEPRIAALVITNDDPEGIAIDNLRFELIRQMGAIGLGGDARASYVLAHVVSIALPPAGPDTAHPSR